MEKNRKHWFRRFTEKLYGGLNMSWPAVILYAVATAVLTAVFLLVPIFHRTSFARMGETFEAWIFFAIIIMANCKKPLESALKTFVFFVVSQPLIYLLQVPFSELGWKILGYYRFWIVWTLLTLPMAYVGWYIRKKNWLSLLILAPILLALTSDYVNSFVHTSRHFPYMLVTALFCLAQVLLYLYRFTETPWQKLVGFFVPLLVVVIALLIRPGVDLTVNTFLPDEPVLTEKAVVVMEEGGIAEVSIQSTGADSMVLVRATEYGTSSFVIRDGEREYRYSLEVYEDDSGHNQIRISPESGQ
ncbi:MAG: hypothetical protein IKS05_10005 [Oscillospiraceae bacterium]|nr:hypothetical protein [Oscillospiraceae bacterium]